MTKKEYFKSKLNEPVMVTCARHYYRGVVRKVGDDGILLSNPSMIFNENSYTTTKPNEEYPIPSDLLITLDSIEVACQPTWCFYGIEKQEPKK